MNRIKPMNLFIGVQIVTAGLVVFILYFANILPLFEKYEGAGAVLYFNLLILAVCILHVMGSILYYLMKPTVRGQEHSPIRTPRGFCILRDQVLVLCSGQELDPIADNGQEHGPITDLIFIK